MNKPQRLFWLPAILLLAILQTYAQQDMPPPKYRMELVYIFESDSPEFIFVISGVGFKSLTSLKNYVSNLPPGSILEWAPGCRRLGREPLLSSEQEIVEFKAFCAEKKITFILVPSG